MSTLAKQAFLAAVARGKAASQDATAARDRVQAVPSEGDEDAEPVSTASRSATKLLPEELAVVHLLELPAAGWAEVDVL